MAVYDAEPYCHLAIIMVHDVRESSTTYLIRLPAQCIPFETLARRLSRYFDGITGSRHVRGQRSDPFCLHRIVAEEIIFAIVYRERVRFMTRWEGMPAIGQVAIRSAQDLNHWARRMEAFYQFNGNIMLIDHMLIRLEALSECSSRLYIVLESPQDHSRSQTANDELHSLTGRLKALKIDIDSHEGVDNHERDQVRTIPTAQPEKS